MGSTTVSLAGQNSSDGRDFSAFGLGLAGLIAGLLALVVGVLAWRRSSRSA